MLLDHVHGSEIEAQDASGYVHAHPHHDPLRSPGVCDHRLDHLRRAYLAHDASVAEGDASDQATAAYTGVEHGDDYHGVRCL